MSTTQEPVNWNGVKALFESQNHSIRIIAEGVGTLVKKFSRIEPKIDRMAEDIALLKVICRVNTRDIAKNSKDIAAIKSSTQRIEKKLTAHDERLSALEVRSAS